MYAWELSTKQSKKPTTNEPKNKISKPSTTTTINPSQSKKSI
jgi:hypothetical protein